MNGRASIHMDRMYRRQRHIYDASRKFYLLGRDSLIRELQPPHNSCVLEIGCGTARNLTLAAREWPEARFFGIDVSQEMLATARRSIARASLGDRVQVALGDATDVDPAVVFGVPAFDRIFISYSLSMIPAWRAALEHAFDLLKPNGSLHIVDFGDFGDLPGWFGKGINRWLGAFSVTPRLELEAELSDLAEKKGATSRIVRRFRGYAIHAVVVAHARRSGDEVHGRDDRSAATNGRAGEHFISKAGQPGVLARG